jgi:hypothetical protein
MKDLEPRGYSRRRGCLADRAQRPWTNGLEDITLIWYGDALAMQGAHRSDGAGALSHMTVMQCTTPSNRRFRPWCTSSNFRERLS